jgi:hypothetical protein
MSEPVGDDFQCDGFGLPDRLGASPTVRESPDRVDGSDPAAVGLPFDLDRQLHLRSVARRSSGRGKQKGGFVPSRAEPRKHAPKRSTEGGSPPRAGAASVLGRTCREAGGYMAESTASSRVSEEAGPLAADGASSSPGARRSSRPRASSLDPARREGVACPGARARRDRALNGKIRYRNAGTQDGLVGRL